ncbi:MAG: hypothetical protein U5L11_17070 [Arhodomonas sp.]|nr:hypothetical protein [Arhodomonas sp.]
MHVTPGAQKYEDDLRDQWQSRWHRDEWRRFLRLLLDTHERTEGALTVLSGEIHLATRGTLATRPGAVASTRRLRHHASAAARVVCAGAGWAGPARASRRSPVIRSGCGPCRASAASMRRSATTLRLDA